MTGHDVALGVLAVALACVFAAAGMGKLIDLRGSREALRVFGVPGLFAGPLAVALPLVELSIAVLLLLAATRAWAAVGALALLLAFCAAIGAAIARGRRPECHCFGQLNSGPVGWRTLARNVVLAGLALVVVVIGRDDPGPGAFSWVSKLEGIEWLVSALGVALAVVMAVGGYAVAHVLRSYGQVLVRLDTVEDRLRMAGFELEEPEEIPQLGRAPGTAAPAFWLPSTDKDRVALGDLLQPGRPLLLLFTSPTCGPCSLLMPTVAQWQREYGDELTVALLSDGDPELIRAEAAEHGLVNVLVDETLSAYEAYEANGTPSAVLVGADGTIASWLAAGADWIETLVEQTLAGDGDATGLAIGSELPSDRLATLSGGEATLAEMVAEPTVILFWNPGCGYCRAMHDDVKAWEQDRPDGAPSLLVISAGSVEDVRADAFSSTVLLDPEWTASAAFGADGTPMAVLVDADGRIASPLVTGAPAVLEFLRADALSLAG